MTCRQHPLDAYRGRTYVGLWRPTSKGEEDGLALLLPAVPERTLRGFPAAGPLGDCLTLRGHLPPRRGSFFERKLFLGHRFMIGLALRRFCPALL
jgi:hypothetical protein